VSNDLYNKLNSNLKDGVVMPNNEKIVSMSKFIEYLYEQFTDSSILGTLKKHNPEIGNIEFKWPTIAFNVLFAHMDKYRSTELIRFEKNGEAQIKLNDHQMTKELTDRIKIKKDFKFEKTFIIPSEIWDNPVTWEWIWKFITNIKTVLENPANIRVVMKTKAENAKIDSKYFDMGLYQVGETQIVGFLDIKTGSTYKWVLGNEKYEEAAEIFNELNKCAEPSDEIAKKFGVQMNKLLKIQGDESR
jgi:hypothetical protein